MRKITASMVAMCVVLGGIAWLVMPPSSAQQPPPDRKSFPHSVVKLPTEPGITPSGLIVHAAEPEHKEDKLEILFSFAIPAEARAELAKRVANGEVVQIQETGQPGVRLVNNISNDGIRHFQVGKGEAVITATDAAHNVSTAVCQ